MFKQEVTKHNCKQATGYWNILPLTGIVCPTGNSPFTIRFENTDTQYWPDKFHT